MVSQGWHVTHSGNFRLFGHAWNAAVRVSSSSSTQTTPKGAEIPVPTREQVMRDLRKVAKPKDSTTDRPKKQRSRTSHAPNDVRRSATDATRFTSDQKPSIVLV